MATKGKEVAVRDETAMMFSNETPDWAKGEGRGNENVGAKDTTLPRLEIVQSQSPIKDTNEEAREGLMFNSANDTIIGDTAYIIPIYYRMEYLVWKDQERGGGFFGSHETEALARERIRQVVAEEGEDEADLEVVDTPVHFCLRVRPDMMSEQIVLSMAKSKAKVSRKWNAAIQIAGGDRFARVYKLTTFKDKNKQNQSFYNFVVQPAGFPPEKLFREAERLYSVFREQGVKADHESAGRSAGTGESGTSPMDTDAI
jgi:hypothetical protein